MANSFVPLKSIFRRPWSQHRQYQHDHFRGSSYRKYTQQKQQQHLAREKSKQVNLKSIWMHTFPTIQVTSFPSWKSICPHSTLSKQPFATHSPRLVARTTNLTQQLQQRKLASSPNPPTTILRVAIVGSGPSGCYTAKYLRSSLRQQKSSSFWFDNVTIDIIERLPTPYGLVRNGVAPDHPEVKNVQNDFDTLFDIGVVAPSTNNADDTPTTSSSDDNPKTLPVTIRFFGNVNVGGAGTAATENIQDIEASSKERGDISLTELRQLYNVVVLAYGCESDRTLGIPGETTLTGVLTAREFVNWYNGHIDYDHIGSKVMDALNLNASKQPKDSKSTTTTSPSKGDDNVSIVIIGQGNVALDCARILAKTKEELQDTDLASRALPMLVDSKTDKGTNGARSIHIIGRRGHVQGAFTIKELRELSQLQNATFHVSKKELEQGVSTKTLEEELDASRPKTRIHKLLHQVAKLEEESNKDSTLEKDQNEPTTAFSNIYLRFLCQPIRLEPSENDETRLGHVLVERTELQTKVNDHDGSIRHVAVGTGRFETIPAQLALISIGYKAIPIPGTEPWYDESKGILRNRHGRVDANVESTSEHQERASLYVSGWLKRGPSGIIGTNIPDAKETVATILEDLKAQSSPSTISIQSTLEDVLAQRQVQVVDWSAAQRIEQFETSNDHEWKRSSTQQREKVTSREKMLQIAFSKQ